MEGACVGQLIRDGAVVVVVFSLPTAGWCATILAEEHPLIIPREWTIAIIIFIIVAVAPHLVNLVLPVGVGICLVEVLGGIAAFLVILVDDSLDLKQDTGSQQNVVHENSKWLWNRFRAAALFVG